MEITAAQVKELREKSGAGIMDCKKALAESEGDIEKAFEGLLGRRIDEPLPRVFMRLQ